MVKMHLFKYTCENCGFEFKAPVLMAGDWFAMRSDGTGELVVSPKYDNPAVNEVNGIVRSLPMTKDRPDSQVFAATQAAYSVAFDTGGDGSPYVMGGKPHCSRCGSSRMAHWQATEPPEFVEQEVPVATHLAWDQLTTDEKRDRVALAVNDYLST